MTRRRVISAHDVALVFEPLGQPVPARGEPAVTDFSASWTSTTTLLRTEAGHLGCSEVVLCIDAPRNAMRQDGGIRADAKVRSDGVEVFLADTHVGALRYSCARFTGRGWRGYLLGWQSNVRAIALGLESLRRVDRYALNSGTEQYAGFRALPPGAIELGPKTMTMDEAALLLWKEGHGGANSGYSLEEVLRRLGSLYRVAASRHHPDKGHDGEMFRQVTAARDLLSPHA